MASGLKFRISVEEGLYYPCGKNKGADQLRGYREADLRLCFRICKKPVFSRRGSLVLCTKDESPRPSNLPEYIHDLDVLSSKSKLNRHSISY